jgi:hypothetical protein
MRRISRSQLAELAGVSRPAITKACDTGKLKAACSGDGVDADHPAVVAFLKRHGKEPMPVAKKPSRAPTAPPAPAGEAAAAPTRAPKLKVSASAAPTDPPKRGRGRPRNPPEDRPENVGHMKPRAGVDEGSDQDLQDLSDAIYPLIDRFGTDFQFSSWLDALKNIELIREKRLKNGETEGGLISWELVQSHVFGLIDACFKRLLGDASKAIASKVSTTLRAGGSLEEAQRNVRDEISKHLKQMKAGAARHLAHKNDAAA